MGKTFRKIRFWAYAVGFPAIIGSLFLFFIARDCRAMPDAKHQVKVWENRGMGDSTDEAMGLLNRAAGCVLFVRVGEEFDAQVRIIPMLDTPCDVDPMHPGIESGHSANAYACPQIGGWDIDVEAPGDLHSMTYIAAHELMHTQGLEDSNYGLMSNNYKPNGRIWPSDKETAHLKTKCK